MSEKNTTLIPLRGYCLIEPLDDDQTSSSGMIISSEQQGRQAKGKVIAMGKPTMDMIMGETQTQEGVIIKQVFDSEFVENDIVWFRRYSGEEVTDTGKKYMFVKYSDILGVYK